MTESTLVIVVQWLHIVCGVIWVGGKLASHALWWPVVLSRPAAEARRMTEAVPKGFSALMLATGVLVWVFGLIRGTLLGSVHSLDFLFGSAYGLTFLLAFVITVGLGMYSGAWHGSLEKRLWHGHDFAPNAKRIIRNNAVLEITLLAVVLACMVLMRFGL